MSQNRAKDKLLIRPLQKADIPSIYKIEAKVYDQPWSEDLLLQSLEAPMTHHLGIFERGTCVAYCIFQIIFSESHLLNLAVAPGHERKGHGSRILDEALKECRSKKVSSMFLEVRPSNRGGVALYRKKGFEDVMIRERYYADGESAVVMILELV